MTDSATTGITIANTGSGNAHDNLHPVMGVGFIIYTGVL
jgi:microcystin-dependent protein